MCLGIIIYVSLYFKFLFTNLWFSKDKASQNVYDNNKHDEGTLHCHMTSTVYLQNIKI